jgi:hypothetical protein
MMALKVSCTLMWTISMPGANIYLISRAAPGREAGAQYSQSPIVAEVGAVMELGLECPLPDLP